MGIELVQKVFREVFHDEGLVISREMTAKDVPDWDSFNHINLIVALEEAFAVSFTADEIAGFSNVGDLIVVLQQKGIAVAWD